MTQFEPSRLLITGGAGVIGSSLARRLLSPGGDGGRLEKVVVFDALTYAGHLANLDGVNRDPRYQFVHADICDRAAVERAFTEHAIDGVFHLAAESHVDRSIVAADAFVRTNVTG